MPIEPNYRVPDELYGIDVEKLKEEVRAAMDADVWCALTRLRCDVCGARMFVDPEDMCRAVCYGCGRRFTMMLSDDEVRPAPSHRSWGRLPTAAEICAVQPMTTDVKGVWEKGPDAPVAWSEQYKEFHDTLMSVAEGAYNLTGRENDLLQTLLVEAISELNAWSAGFPPTDKDAWWKQHLCHYVEYKTGSRRLAEEFLAFVYTAEKSRTGDRGR